MKKNLFLRLCLMTIALLSLNSCRQDILHEQEAYHNSGAFQLTSKRISLNEAKHKTKLLPELEKAETELKTFSKTNTQGKVINYANGVSIDTDNVTYIENGPNFHTYTFNLTRDNSLPTDPVENLVLIPTTDGTYRELLVSYSLTLQEKQTLMNGGHVDTKGKATITELAKGTYNNGGLTGRSSCGWDYSLGYTICDGNDHHSNGELPSSEGGPCRALHPSVQVLVAVYACYDINDTNPIGNDWWAGPGGSSGVGGGGCTDCPPNEQNPPTEPCNGNGVATGPLDPNSNIGEGGCEGIVTMPTLPIRNNPCEKIKKVGKNEVTKNTMKDLKTKVNDNKEHIYLLWEDSNGNLKDDIYGTGPVNGGGINFNFSSGDKFSALLHSHYNRPDMLSTFSFDDFISMCSLIHFNAIKDQDSFVMGAVTASGTQYMMVIDDPAKLASFASQIFVNGIFDEKTASNYEDFYNGSVYSTNTIENNELGLALFLDSQSIGLKLMKGDDQMENWQQFTKNTQGNIVAVNCN